MAATMPCCRGCDRELAPREVREAVIETSTSGRELYGPLCQDCAAPLLAGMSFAKWLDVQWERQKARMRAAPLVALVLIVAVQAGAQTTTLTSKPGAFTGETVFQAPNGRVIGTSKPGAFTGETVFQAPNGRIIGTSKPGAFTGETVFQAPSGRILCTTRPGAFRGETTAACR